MSKQYNKPKPKAEKKPEPKKKPDPKTWMCKRGELLWEEKFEDGKWSKEWNRYKGNFVVEGDAVPGVGRIDSIVRWGNRWIVATASGLIATP